MNTTYLTDSQWNLIASLISNQTLPAILTTNLRLNNA